MLEVPRRLLEYVEQIHAIVDDAAAKLSAQHAARLNCRRGCASCCKDDLTITEVEAALIQAHHPEVLAQTPRAPGACAFLDADDACRIYDHRPYICRTQGLPLRWIEQELAEDGAVEVFEYRDICPLNDETGPPLEDLPPEAMWTLGPVEQRLRAAQEQADGGQGRRVSLRSLFYSSAKDAS